MLDETTGEYVTLNIHELIKEYKAKHPTSRMGLVKKIRIWLMEQGITESEPVELDIEEIHFLAEFVGFKSKPTEFRKGLRGPIIMYGKDKMEFSLQYDTYDWFIYNYVDFPGLVGPTYFVVNIQFNEHTKKFLEEQCG